MHTRALTWMVALGLLATACGNDTPESGSTTPPSTAGEPSGTVVLLTHDSFALTPELLEAFEAETGITVEVQPSGDAGAVLNRAILTAGEPEGDVLFGVDSNLLGRALAEDLFLPYESALLEHVPEHLRVDEHVTPIDVGDVCLNTDLAYFEENDLEAPDGLDDLVDPAYEGLTVVEDPSTSSPGLAFLLATVVELGDDWEQWWADLRANDVLVESGWESAYYGAFSGGSGEGDRPIVVSYASSPAAEVYFSEGALTEAPTGVVTSSCFGQVEYAGILRGTSNEPAARALVDFLLSPEVQADIPLQMFVYPVRGDVPLPAVFNEHAEPIGAPLTMDPVEIDAQREDLIARWTEIVLR
jgi:thiamine transport system substrate-binding protein